MTWSYDPTLSTDRDWMRFRLFDTTYTNQIFQNEELDAMLAQYGDKRVAAAYTAEQLAARYAGAADSKKIGDLTISSAGQSERYRNLAMTLREEIARNVAPYAGGISISDKQAQEDDTDQVQSPLRVGMTDNPEVANVGDLVDETLP